MLITMRYIAILSLLLLLFGCSAAKKQFDTGKELEEQGRYEEAMFRYAEAFQKDPYIAEYRLKFLATRQKAAMAREKSGDTNMAAGRYAEAVTDFQAAGGLNPGEARYSQKAAEATRQRDALLLWQEGQNLEKTHKLREAAFAYQRAVELVPGNKEYVAAVTRLDSMKKSRLDSYKLQLKSSQPITLQFNETRVKDIFNVVSQLSGITFVFDNDVKDQSSSISLTNANFYQALDLLTSMSKLGRKVLNESTILLYTRTPDKIKQYEDMVVRIYNLNYLDAKKAIAFIKGLLQIRKLQQHDEGNAIAIRDTQEVTYLMPKWCLMLKLSKLIRKTPTIWGFS